MGCVGYSLRGTDPVNLAHRGSPTPHLASPPMHLCILLLVAGWVRGHALDVAYETHRDRGEAQHARLRAIARIPGLVRG